MDNIILDLGLDVNILLKETWDMRRKPKITWSPIQLILENQYKIFPIGALLNI